MATSTQLQDMDDIALLEAARDAIDFLKVYEEGLIVQELIRRFEPHAQAPDHQDYPFIANEENLK